MNKQRPQYKATPELQKVVDAIAPSITKTLKLKNTPVKLRSFSKYD